MVLPQHLSRASGVIRWFGILVLLAGVAAMHAGVFVTHDHSASHQTGSISHGAMSAPHEATIASHGAIPAHGATTASHKATTASYEATAELYMYTAQSVVHDASSLSPAAPGPHADCGDGSCPEAHGGLHGCVFILTVLALAIALIALYRVAGDRSLGEVTAVRQRRPGRAPPPPWTVPSLSELSILRI